MESTHAVLRVQSEAYDVLLDKLPWPVSEIRLPWLPQLLLVQWLQEKQRP